MSEQFTGRPMAGSAFDGGKSAGVVQAKCFAEMSLLFAVSGISSAR
jgi:hypothetical protein